MTRDTLILLLMIGALSLILTVAVVLVFDAMVWQPPADVETALRVSGSVSG
jgi:hypothetical protein